MSLKHTIIKGTFILTVTGFATRFMGFFYRIFMSHMFGEEGVGLYQLIFPVYALCFSVTSAGIETALARCVAKHLSTGQKKEAFRLLYTALILSVSASVAVMFAIQQNASWIAVTFLHEKRCAPFLVILSYAFPFASVHSCIIGYCLGQKETKTPAVSQLIEQTVRILSVWLICSAAAKNGLQMGVSVAVSGLVFGEVASSLFCLKTLSISTKHTKLSGFKKSAEELLKHACPLTASRVLLNLLQSIEAVSIPSQLQLYGMSVAGSLSTYGVLTGMALPCIMFPSAITNSVSTMLLPAVAEAQSRHHSALLRRIIQKSISSCIFLGFICCVALLILGPSIGNLVFHSSTAGDFIVTLAWICPFLYTNTTLTGILNGIGKTVLTLCISTASLFLRILCVFTVIPHFGIQGYLWGLLASQLTSFFLCLLALYRYEKKCT